MLHYVMCSAIGYGFMQLAAGQVKSMYAHVCTCMHMYAHVRTCTYMYVCTGPLGAVVKLTGRPASHRLGT